MDLVNYAVNNSNRANYEPSYAVRVLVSFRNSYRIMTLHLSMLAFFKESLFPSILDKNIHGI